MNGSFSVGPKSVQGLGLDLSKGESWVKDNLVLLRHGDSWTLIDTQKESLSSADEVVRGEALVALMQVVANGAKELPPQFIGRELKNLTHNAKFRNLCRLVPGLENALHVESRAKSAQALRRGVETAKTVGKGLNKIEGLGLKGRYVGQDQGKHSYWIREVIFKNTPARELDILRSGWEIDSASSLSLGEWAEAKKREWEVSGKEISFLPWIAANTWRAEQQKAWEEAHPQEVFSETKFQAWPEQQPDPQLFLPKWLLRKISEKTDEGEFQAWRRDVLKDREAQWTSFKEETGIDLTFEEHEKLDFAHGSSGSIDSVKRWMLQQLWHSSGTADDFPDYVRRMKWMSETRAGKTQESFVDWNEAKNKEIVHRYEGSKLPLSFEDYRSQQDDDIFTDPAPFISLGNEERKLYETQCDQGRLIRNGFIYDTAFEKTLHSGPGFAIFVIGADEDLYCGSHIGGVFHHSSFLGDGATVAAGEIKTNPSGEIIELSSKSGHYRPTDEENLYMLRFFRDRGVALSNVKFTYYNTDGKTEEKNALLHLQELESKV